MRMANNEFPMGKFCTIDFFNYIFAEYVPTVF